MQPTVKQVTSRSTSALAAGSQHALPARASSALPCCLTAARRRTHQSQPLLRQRQPASSSRRHYRTSTSLQLAAAAAAVQSTVPYSIDTLRNIGISAHIDSGKTTLTERILYYTGRIREIHDVKGKDNVGAFMDSMELEREKGITIQSAATFCQWNQHAVNIIDTPGHVDFTIEVERALRVLDGAIMVLCGVAGVQSQSLTVDRQMKRYSVPRIAFINKLDRMGANPFKPLEDIRKVLLHNAALLQLPIGSEGDFVGVVDLVEEKAMYFEGGKGDVTRTAEIPTNMLEQVAEYRHKLIEALSEVDDDMAELFLADEKPITQQFHDIIRRATLALKFVPVFIGSAFKNKGVQPLLDAVIRYLPRPNEKTNIALDQGADEAPVELKSDAKAPFVGLAFKLEERPFGQLTYLRCYQGTVKKGEYLNQVAVTGTKKVKIQRIVKMHSNSMEDVTEAKAGEIVALFGIDCPSGTTFTSGTLRYTMTSMHIPESVISLSIAPKVHAQAATFGKALQRFQKEDPTFRVHADEVSGETIISGMGELHLEIYVERMRREYKVECTVGQPKVNYRESCAKRAPFNYTHKKQSGGAGQYGKIIGYLEPTDPTAGGKDFEFVNQLVGNSIPPEFHETIGKGFNEAIKKGLAGYPVQNIRFVLTDGGAHPVDSNENAFKAAALGAFRQAFKNANPTVLEPVMRVDVEVPTEFQGSAVSGVNRRRGLVANVESLPDGMRTLVQADVPLSKMFGYSTDLRSSTEGKGEFTMEYKDHQPVPRDEQEQIVAEYERTRYDKVVD